MSEGRPLSTGIISARTGSLELEGTLYKSITLSYPSLLSVSAACQGFSILSSSPKCVFSPLTRHSRNGAVLDLSVPASGCLSLNNAKFTSCSSSASSLAGAVYITSSGTLSTFEMKRSIQRMSIPTTHQESPVIFVFPVWMHQPISLQKSYRRQPILHTHTHTHTHTILESTIYLIQRLPLQS